MYKFTFILVLLLSSTVFAGVFEDMAKLPKISRAKIRRGKTEISVDLSVKPQIRDYDVLLLEEGVYSTLGDSSAKYVRVVGKGKNKTFITSNVKGSKPILVNSTEFWDVTLADAQLKIVDVNGLWAINVGFAGSIVVRPAAEDKVPAFALRSIFSDAPFGENLNIGQTPADLLAYEDQLDQMKDIDFKKRTAYKGLVARAANYLYQTNDLQPPYDQKKYTELTKRAKTAKAKGHIYVSMLTWAEADRLSRHYRFDEVLREITPLQQNLGQECGCTVEGQGLATSTKNEIERELYAKVPIMALPGKCRIQAMVVSENTPTAIASARMEAKNSRSNLFQATAMGEEDFAVGAAMVETKPLPKKYTAVADVEMKGLKKTLTSDVSEDQSSISENIIEPIARAFNEQFSSRIKAAAKKISSGEIFTKMDGFLLAALYGSDKERQNDYETLHEQQFGRKVASEAAVGSVLSY